MLTLVSLARFLRDLLPSSARVRRSGCTKLVPTASSFACCAATIPAIGPRGWGRSFFTFGHARSALRGLYLLAMCFRDGFAQAFRKFRVGMYLGCGAPLSNHLPDRHEVLQVLGCQ